MRQDWPEILAYRVESMVGVSFEWGKTDCCMFAADIVAAMTGIDYAAEFRGRYKTMRGAARLLRKKSLVEIMDGKLHRTKHPKRGDVVLIDETITQQPIPALGVCLGRHIVLMGDDGIEYLPVGTETIAWDVHRG